MRGKLINGALVKAPKDIVYNNVLYSPANDYVLACSGWKEVVYTQEPEAPELMKYVCHFEDGEKITLVWELVELTREEKIEHYKQCLLDTDKYFIQYSDGGSTAEEYEAMKIQRQEWRNKINELEAKT